MRSTNELLSELHHLGFQGKCNAFTECVEKLGKFSKCQSPVLIEGETGTGKELAARALHYLGPRKDQPFIPTNCGGLTDNMFENELFGHQKGAYTDARDNHEGLVAIANRGTLFLDEVDSLSPRSQVSLLRFLEDQKYRPLGCSQFVQADIHVISATNVNLRAKVDSGLFRKDLMFRLETITIIIPSLRERCEDIETIANHFLYYLSELYNQPVKKLHSNLLLWMKEQEWPGNIRELQNFLHREFLLAEKDTIFFSEKSEQHTPGARPQVQLDHSCFQLGYDEIKRRVIQDFNHQYLDQLMQNTHGNVSRAARIIKKDRRALGRLLDKNCIDRKNYLEFPQKVRRQTCRV